MEKKQRLNARNLIKDSLVKNCDRWKMYIVPGQSTIASFYYPCFKTAASTSNRGYWTEVNAWRLYDFCYGERTKSLEEDDPISTCTNM